jgi:hypothetical protein
MAASRVREGHASGPTARRRIVALDVVADEGLGQGGRADGVHRRDYSTRGGRAVPGRPLEEGRQIVPMPHPGERRYLPPDPPDHATRRLAGRPNAGQELLDGVARAEPLVPGAQRGDLRLVRQRVAVGGFGLLGFCYGPPCFHARQFTCLASLTR